MKLKKRFFPSFSFYDRTGIQQYLEEKAAEGWLLEKIGGIGWKFCRIEPMQIHFAVTYFPKASAYDPEPSEEQKRFQEFCAHAGWILADANGQMQIFYNTAEHPTPIETDPEIELNNIHKSARKTFLFSYWGFLAIALLQLGMFASQLNKHLIDTLSSNWSMFNGISWLILLVVYGSELLRYYRWRRKAKAAAKRDGSFVSTKSSRMLQKLLLGVYFLAFGFMFMITDGEESRTLLLFTLTMSLVLIAVCFGITTLLKKKKVSAVVNRAVTIISVVLVTMLCCGALMMLLFMGILDAALDGMFEPEEYVETYEYHGETYEVYHDNLDLTIEDIIEVEYDGYSYKEYVRESMLLRVVGASQRPRWDALDQPDLQYTMVEVKADWLYDACVEDMLDQEDGGYSVDIYGNISYDVYRAIETELWGAEAAYQLYIGDEPVSQYLLCYEGLILELNPDWDMTEQDMIMVGIRFNEEFLEQILEIISE